MIGPSGQHHNGLAFLPGLTDDLIAPGPHLGEVVVVFLLPGFQCFLHLFQSDIGEVLLQNRGHFVSEIFWTVQADVIGDEYMGLSDTSEDPAVLEEQDKLDV